MIIIIVVMRMKAIGQLSMFISNNAAIQSNLTVAESV